MRSADRNDTPSPADGVDEMSDEQKRRDQLLRAAGSTEQDAAPRIRVSERDGITRVDIAPDAAVRPGNADAGEDTAPGEAGAPGEDTAPGETGVE